MSPRSRAYPPGVHKNIVFKMGRKLLHPKPNFRGGKPQSPPNVCKKQAVLNEAMFHTKKTRRGVIKNIAFYGNMGEAIN